MGRLPSSVLLQPTGRKTDVSKLGQPKSRRTAEKTPRTWPRFSDLTFLPDSLIFLRSLPTFTVRIALPAVERGGRMTTVQNRGDATLPSSLRYEIPPFGARRRLGN